MKKFIFIFSFTFLISFGLSAESSLLEVKQQLDKIERDVIDLQKQFYSNKDQETLSIQNSSSDISVFDMRLRDIEKELKNINFNYENLTFEIDELKSSLEDLNLKLNNTLISNTQEINEVDENQLESNKENSNENDGTLGTLTINSEDLSDEGNNLSNLEESSIFDETTVVTTNLTPEEKFQNAFDLLRLQNFEEAKEALNLFIEENETNELSGSAHYWLGEIYLLKKENREAALIFAEGYQKFPNSLKAPDTLYKLSEALIKIGKINEACDTLKQFSIKFPENKLNTKTKLKMNEIDCNQSS